MLFPWTLEEVQTETPSSRIKLRFCRSCEAINEAEHKRCKNCDAQLPSPITAYPNGTRLRGKYEIERLLGCGGMGIVYQARHLLLRRQVALKCIHPHLVSEENVFERFQREAIAASEVEHPNALRVLDLDLSDDGVPILVTELLVGRDLERALRQKEDFPVHRIIRLMTQALDALAIAHEKGILHRDIKPQNLFLVEQDGQEQVKIVDFGLAKLLDRGKESRELTNQGISMGTPAYMSPEQVRGEALDQRTDLWSIGVVMYQLLTGRLPFMGETAMSTALAVLKEDLSPIGSGSEEDLHRALGLICKRILSKNKDLRPPNAKALREELLSLLARPEPKAAAAPVETPKAKEVAPQDTIKATSAPLEPSPQPEPQLRPLTTEAKPAAPPRSWLPIAALSVVVLVVGLAYSFSLSTKEPKSQGSTEPSPLLASASQPLPKSTPLVNPQNPIKEPQSNHIEPKSQPQSAPKTNPEVKPENTKHPETKPANPQTPANPEPKPGAIPPGFTEFTYGKSLVRSGKFKDAVPLLEKVVKAEPTNAMAHRYLGDAYKGINKKPQAISEWKEFLRLDPGHPEAELVRNQIEANK